MVLRRTLRCRLWAIRAYNSRTRVFRKGIEGDGLVMHTLHCCDISALDIVFKLLNLLLELIQADELVLYPPSPVLENEPATKTTQLTNDEGNLELLDTITNRNELGRTPNKTLLLDRADRFLELGHVGLVVPRLDLERNDRLGNRLGLVSLARVVLGDTLGLETLGLLVVFIVIAK